MLSPSVVALVALVMTYLGILFSRFARLRHIPGPKLAAVTDLWAAIRTWRGERYHEYIQDLHSKYGPVVRWGPNRVSFSEPAAIPAIYGTSHVFLKAASYKPMTVMSHGQEIPTLVTIRDEKRITGIKKHIAAGFSQSTWLSQESQIDSTIGLLIERLDQMPRQTVRLDNWMRFWQFDTLTKLSFGESRGYLSAGADLDEIFPASMARFAHWEKWASMPSLEAFICKNPISQKLQKSTGTLVKVAMRQIQIRQSGDKHTAGNDLMGRYLAASQAAPDVIAMNDVLALTISTIHAGSETTATASTMMMADSLQNPHAYEKLEREILEANLSIPAEFKAVDKLPYLDAVTRESMRLFINPHCTERTVPSEGATICGNWVPGGTDVSIAEVLTARDPEVFGADTNAFRPERWLEADENQWREMDRSSFGFSYGRRVCIGQHLARIEMKKVVAALVGSFKFTLVGKPVRGFRVEAEVRVEPRM
ncbi:probable Benzoate 4-monooxygenase cytochrome P450 [Lecanosticta acicola]|uniref:Probable Benzoate 4-monooxygenase cytochrome P450 n=1 Tax=Lecanosticta acicola TaxID=111012 RepID=A0AAI8YRD3_9PEZI|nr:probable Benzoate 4-monooxygenase cytochrome P450 [Lecanosticta acicola]